MAKIRPVLLVVIFLALVSVAWRWGGELKAETAQDYHAVGVRQGVWNNGQAALWDLNFLDYFHYFGPPERARGHQPEQPIKFSHVTHVQKNQMDCQFCHWSVDKAAYAAIPEVETCMGCHLQVSGTEQWQKDEINKLKKKNEAGQPIEWTKVHVMPDHVRFNHKRHVKAGVTCQNCHGQIPEMQVVERVSSMKMGWCIDCHRTQGTSIDCYTCHK
ncbi:MAG: cytochrome c family protein [Oligoflexia bacterium]|nr:cytochrome c family protein [Oligoflexia bacterium]